MPRKMSAEREHEYDELLAYIDFIATNIWRISTDSPIHPTNAGKQVVLQYGKSKALQGLRQAAADTVEMWQHEPKDFVQSLDARLKAEGILTVSEVRYRYAASFKRVVKSGTIRTETEYMQIKGVVCDLGNNIPDEERVVLQGLLNAYEEKIA